MNTIQHRRIRNWSLKDFFTKGFLIKGLLCRIVGHRINYQHAHHWCGRCRLSYEEIYPNYYDDIFRFREIEILAREQEFGEIAWNAYRDAVGGVAFNGDPLPTWEKLTETKGRIAYAWVRAGTAAAARAPL